jgi:methylenetetrahydrofolate reductase (NADPH)
MSKLRTALEQGEFVVTAETAPPKGTDVSAFLARAEALAKHVYAVNVTEMQNARMRLGSVPACHLMLERGIEAIAHVTCRDRNRLALQSDSLAAWVFGIKNILCLTGDHTRLGDHPESKPVFDLDSVQLIQTIATLNSGHDLAGNQLEGHPDFFIGAVVNPTAEALDLQAIKMRKKVAAGARFFQSQAVFEPQKLADFLALVQGVEFYLIAGVVFPKSAATCRYMNEHVPGVHVPEWIIKELDGLEKVARQQKAIEICSVIIRQLKSLCHGVHVMTLGREDLLPEILDRAGIGPKRV